MTPSDPHWTSIIPPLLAVGLAFITRDAIISLLIACFVGILMMGEGIAGFPPFLVRALGNEDFIWICLIEFCIGILVCAFPQETVELYRLAMNGAIDDARKLYRWFMPLLHLDVSTKLVQNIKLVEALVSDGSETVRAPRLPLVGLERDRVESIVRQALANRPRLIADEL